MANISVNPNISPYSYSGGTQEVAVTYDVLPEDVCAATTSDSWISVSIVSTGRTDSSTNIVYSVAVSENDGPYRTGNVIFRCISSGSTTTSNMNIIRQGTNACDYKPIWMDTYYYARNKDVFNYMITSEGVPVFTGKSYCAPGNGGPYIKVNGISSDFLSNGLGDFRNIVSDVISENAVGRFSICDEYGAECMNWIFLKDYTSDWTGQTEYNMVNPINGHMDPRMKVFYTIYNDSETTINYSIDS